MDSGVSPSSALDLYTGVRNLYTWAAGQKHDNMKTTPVATREAPEASSIETLPAAPSCLKHAMSGKPLSTRRTVESDAVVQEQSSGTGSPPAVLRSYVTTQGAPSTHTHNLLHVLSRRHLTAPTQKLNNL